MRIKSIRHNTLDSPKQYYDVINANPYNNFLIKTNSTYICAHNCFFDEINKTGLRSQWCVRKNTYWIAGTYE